MERFNHVAGTQTALPLYQFTDDTLLVETAHGIRELGSNAIKLSMSARYCTVEYRLPRDERIRSLTDLAALEPSFRQVLDMDFRYYLFWAYSFSQYRGGGGQADLVSFIDGFSTEESEQVYREFFDLSRHLLETYSGSGKVFYLGHWEGDWHLRPDYDRTRWVLRSGLEWGCPFVLYWELYNNEAEPDGTQRGYWMVDDRGNRTPVYDTYAAYYRQARELVAEFLGEHGRPPTPEEFGRAALELPALAP